MISPPFLCVSIHCDPSGTFTFTQQGLINKIIHDIGMQDSSSPNHTLASPSCPWIQILMDLPSMNNGTILPLLACFSFLPTTVDLTLLLPLTNVLASLTTPSNPMLLLLSPLSDTSRELPLKGLSFKPQNNLALDCYVDADFCGLWNSESLLMIPSLLKVGLVMSSCFVAVLLSGLPSCKLSSPCPQWRLSMLL